MPLWIRCWLRCSGTKNPNNASTGNGSFLLLVRLLARVHLPLTLHCTRVFAPCLARTCETGLPVNPSPVAIDELGLADSSQLGALRSRGP